MTALERRLQKLEAKLSEILPNTDLESILTPESSSPGFGTWSLSDGGAESPVFKPSGSILKTEAPSDVLPEASNGFEWIEDEFSTSQLSDGMAALSVDPQGVGFLGRISLRVK